MSDEDPVKLHLGAPGDPIFEACFEAMEAMRKAVAPIVHAQGDPRDGLTIIMSAAAMFAGVQGGTLLALGALQNQDRRRMGETALTNFRQGVEYGRNMALRIGAEQFGGNA